MPPDETSSTPIAKPYYPFVSRLLVELYHAGALPNVTHIDLEPVYGYVGRVSYRNGGVRLFKQGTLSVNPDGAAEISRDKGYTKHYLAQLGYHVPRGKVFLLPRFLTMVNNNLGRYGFTDHADLTRIHDYITAKLGYPCFVKPNDESQGRGVHRCEDAEEVTTAVAAIQALGGNTLIVEAAVPFPDYRVVVFDGAVITCYHRKPLSVIGDGTSTVYQLLHAQRETWRRQGRSLYLDVDDSRITKALRAQGLNREATPAVGQRVKIYEIANLSLGGEAEDHTERLHLHWQTLCVQLTAQMGLRLCGVDLACADITDSNANYSIIETNASPGMENYAALGAKQAQIVRNLYTKIFNELPQHR